MVAVGLIGTHLFTSMGYAGFFFGKIKLYSHSFIKISFEMIINNQI
jgi:hypothetical protein